MASYDASIRVDTRISTEKAQEQLKALENRMEKVRQRTEALVKKKTELETFVIKTDAYKELENQLAEAAKKFDELIEQQDHWQALGVDNKSIAWEKLLREQETASQNIDEIKNKMKQLEYSGKAFTNMVGTDEYTKVCDDLTNAVNETELLNMKTEHLNNQYQRAKESAEKCFDTLQRGGKKSNKMFATLLSRFKGIILSLLVFNWISKGFNAMVSSMQKGFQNLAHYSEEYNRVVSDMKSQSATLKNNLAAAFEPIVTMIIPYITRLISWLNTATNYLAQFWAVLSGKNTYTKAKKQVVDYAKSLKEASGSAKGALATFDEINVLDKDNGNSAGGETTGADAFEEAEVDQSKFAWVEWIRDNLYTILGIVELIGLAFISWKIPSGFEDSLFSLLGIAIAAGGAFIFIKNAVDAWKNGIDWENLSGMLSGAVGLVAGLGLAFGGVGATIGALVAGIGLLVVGFKDIMENGVNLKNSLAVIAGTFLTVSSVAGAAVGAIAALVAGLVLAIVADWENFKQMVVEPLKKWMSVLLDNAGEALEGIKDILNGVIQFIKGAFTGNWKLAWEGIKNIFSGAWKAIEGTVKLVVNTIIGIINTMVNGLAGAINAVINAINSISFDVPDWVPIWGGDTISPNIPNIPAPTNIPYLEYGGTVTQETYAKISEGNRKEVVLPLEQHTEWADLLAEKIGTKGNTIIRFEGSLAELGRILKPVIDSENSRVGVSLAQN